MKKLGINLASLTLGLSITMFSAPIFGMAEESKPLSATETTGPSSSLEIKMNISSNGGKKAADSKAHFTVQEKQRQSSENNGITKKSNVKAQVNPETIKSIQKKENKKQEWGQVNADTTLTKAQNSEKHEPFVNAASEKTANDSKQAVRPTSNQKPARETKNSLIKVEIKNAPVLGDVKVNAITHNEKKSSNLTEATTKDTSVPGNARHAEKESTGSERTDKGVVEVTTKDTSVLGDVHAGVLDRHTAKEAAGGERTDEGIVEVSKKDTSVLGDVHAGVLDRHTAKEAAGGERTDEGVVEVLTKDTPVLGDVHAGVLDRHAAKESTSSERTDKGVVEVATKDTPVLGDIHVGVLDHHLMNSGPGSTQSSGAIVDATLEELPILEDTHLGVLERTSQVNAEGTAGQDSGAKLTIENGVLEGLDLAILEKEWFIPAASLPKTDTPVISAPEDTGDTDITAPQPNKGNEEEAAGGMKNPEGNLNAPGSGMNPDNERPGGEEVSGNQEENEGNLSGDQSNPNSGKNSSQLDFGSKTISVKLNKRNRAPLSPGTTPGKHKHSVKDKPQSLIANKLMNLKAVDWTPESLKAHASTIEDGLSVNRVNEVKQGQMESQETRLPKTGGFLDSNLLFLFALSLISSGYFIYRKNKRADVLK